MKKSTRTVYITVGILWALALFFAFALIGYRTTALCLMFAGCMVLIFYGIAQIKNPKTVKILRTVLIALLALGFCVFAALEVYIIKDARTDRNPGAQYLLVLGAGVNGTQPSLSLYNRLTAARDYLNAYPDALVIVSGGQGPGEDITEAQCMYDWLTENGVAADRIILEEQATSTEENIALAQALIEGRGDDPQGRLAIVSSEYHLCRAKLMAQKLGIEPVGVAAVTTKPVLRVNYFIREALAVAWFWAFER